MMFVTENSVLLPLSMTSLSCSLFFCVFDMVFYFQKTTKKLKPLKREIRVEDE